MHYDFATFCPFCGKDLGVNDLKCKNCGKRVRSHTSRLCHGCSKKIPIAARICPFCGYDHKKDRKEHQYCAWCPKCKKYKKNLKVCPKCGYEEK